MNEIKKLVAELAVLCERFNINYALFYSESPHTLSGGANLTTEELAIMIETLSRSQPIEELMFLRHVMDMVIRERQSSNWN